MVPAGHAALRRYYAEVWQQGNVAILDDLLTSDYVDHDPLPGFGADRAAAKAMARHVTAAMTDIRIEVHHLIAVGGLAAAHWTMTWQPPGGPDEPTAGPGQPAAGPGQPPAGPRRAHGTPARIGLRGHDFFRLRGNRICEVWHCERPLPGSVTG